MTNKKFWMGILVFALVFGMFFIGCGGADEPPIDNPTSTTDPTNTDPITKADITYTITADGTADTVTTTQLSFTFSAAVSGLTAEDIAITAGTGSASKETLTGSGTSWNLGITDVSAGTVKVKIVKTGIESGEKTVTVNEDKADGSSQEQAITLSITKWKDGSVATGEAKWYKFEAASETKYNVQWKDIYSKPDSDDYTGDVTVTAYQSDGTANLSGFNKVDSGWTFPKTVSGISGTVYLKVEPYYNSYSETYSSGTYAIRFYDPAIIVPQIPVSISAVSATPVPTVIVSWNYISDTSGYRVYRSSTETGIYTQIGSNITNNYTISYTDTTVSAGNTYWYKVAAYNSIGEAEKSGAKQSDTVPNTSVGTSLIIGAAITEGTLSTATQVVWYKFTAISGTTYNVQWADSYQKPDGSSYTGDIKVSAFKNDGTPITSFQNVDSGWTTPKTISGESGTVYLKVEAYIYGSTTKTGTYGIKVY